MRVEKSPGNGLFFNFSLIHLDDCLHLLLPLQHVIDILLQLLYILGPALEVNH